MTTDIKTSLINDLCISIQDTILIGIEQQPNDFIYLINTINLLTAFQNNGIKIDTTIFTDIYMDNLYREIRTFLLKPYKIEE
ncbi:hypothetical protein M2475_001965 [Breznakia sp. PF5-3]|nr:hypothetical protein [Breznakia sp. PM6-1]MDF9836385.1 hypothetical protein [Breznakia sp. PF5-3]MDF9838729.1 hypothetical protein [Breznakia sp. PFB2-8]MDF9860537.1 hypothetical protein [Breznakia sp. PH5-24]